MRVGFDSDGVLDNFGEGVRETLVSLGKGDLWKSGPTKEPYWDFYKDWSNEDGTRWTGTQFKDLCDYGVDAGIIFTGHWRDGAAEAVAKVRALGHEVIIITDRAFGSDPLNSQDNTLRAYEKAGIIFDEIYFSPDKTIGNCDMFVEDRIDNYEILRAYGVDCYLINRAWNLQDDDRLRIPDVAAYAEIVALKTVFDKSSKPRYNV